MWSSRHACGVMAVLAGVAGLALAGCSSSGGTAGGQPSGPVTSGVPVTSSAPSSSAPAGGSRTSCGVITQDEASAALGQPVKPPIMGKAVVEGGVACVFYGPDVPSGVSPDIPVADSVRVVLVTGSNAKKWFDDYRSKVSAQAISGLGDEAYYDGYASTSVLKGDAYVRIAVGIANNLDAEKQLAADALPRM